MNSLWLPDSAAPANSIQKSPSNHLLVIGRQPPKHCVMSGPTKGVNRGSAIQSHEGRKRRQEKAFRVAGTKMLRKKALTFVLSSLLFTATVLEGLFGEYHSSSAALGQQHPEVTKQPLTCDWSATSKALCDVNRHFARNTEIKFVQGVNTMIVKDLARLPLHCHCT